MEWHLTKHDGFSILHAKLNWLDSFTPGTWTQKSGLGPWIIIPLIQLWWLFFSPIRVEKKKSASPLESLEVATFSMFILTFRGLKFSHPILGISNPTRNSVGFKRAKMQKKKESPWFQVPQALSGKSPSRVPTTCSTRLLLGFCFFSRTLVHWKTTRKTLVRRPPPSTYVDTNWNRKVCALTLLPMALQHQRKIIACESC